MTCVFKEYKIKTKMVQEQCRENPGRRENPAQVIQNE